MQCKRCNESTSWTNDMARLRGGVCAHLCAGCITAWHDRVREKFGSEHLEVDVAVLSLNLSSQTQKPSDDEVRRVAVLEKEFEKKLFDEGKRFVAEKVEPADVI